MSSSGNADYVMRKNTQYNISEILRALATQNDNKGSKTMRLPYNDNKGPQSDALARKNVTYLLKIT